MSLDLQIYFNTFICCFISFKQRTKKRGKHESKTKTDRVQPGIETPVDVYSNACSNRTGPCAFRLFEETRPVDVRSDYICNDTVRCDVCSNYV